MRSLSAALAALLLALGLSFGIGIADPGVAVACSCIGPQPLAGYAGPDTVIFSGTVVADDADGVRVGVDRWFSGTGAAAVVLISGEFSNGASCGIGSRPAVGTRWIWVAWRPQGEGLANPLDPGAVQVNICQPFADLATPEGEALLAEAVATFGEGAAAPSSPESPGAGPADSPTIAATPAPTASPAPAEDGGPSAETLALIAAVGTLAVGAGVLAVVLLVARRRSGGGPAGA